MDLRSKSKIEKICFEVFTETLDRSKCFTPHPKFFFTIHSHILTTQNTQKLRITGTFYGKLGLGKKVGKVEKLGSLDSPR